MLTDSTPPVLTGGIWPPDWSQALPDGLNALLTGAAIAGIVWWLDRARQNRDMRARANDGWRRLAPTLRTVFAEDLVRFSDTFGYSQAAKDLRFLLQPFPVDEWTRAAPKNLPLQAAARLERDWPELEILEQRARNLIGGALRGATPSGRMFDGYAQGALTNLLLIKIRGGNPEDDTGFTTLQQQAVAPDVIRVWLNAAATDPRLVSAIHTHDALFARVAKDHKTVRGDIASHSAVLT